MNRMIDMVARQLIRRLISKGIAAGIDHAAGGRDTQKAGHAPRIQASKQMHQSAKMMRRITRM